MRAITSVATVFLVGAFMCPVCAAEDAGEITGVWEVVSFTLYGRQPPIPPNSQIVIEKDCLIFKIGETTQKVPMKLDGTKSPKQIDLTVPGPPESKEKTLTQPGIYKLEGDRLLICVTAFRVVETPKDAKAGGATEPAKVEVGDRPTAFQSEEAGLYVLERKKQ